jgi:hypothetical protein
MHLATSNRPANSVNDKYYKKEVELLRPGTKLPSASTVGRDLKVLYFKGSEEVKEYFSVCIPSAFSTVELTSCQKYDGWVHTAADGWTAPHDSSNLGLVIVWHDNGVIHRAVLEFIQLHERHTGIYMGRMLADCLRRYGLDEKLYALCMDNASNCDTMADQVAKEIPSFAGKQARIRCLPHTINLMAKVSIHSSLHRRSRTSAGCYLFLLQGPKEEDRQHIGGHRHGHRQQERRGGAFAGG